jgi:hypothetical protein
MKRLPLLALAFAGLAVACSPATDTTQPDAAEDFGTPMAADDMGTATAADGVVALGLTRSQLEDAEIVDANGVELAEVERIVTDASGAVTALVVEIDDTSPDRYVALPLDGLEVTRDGNDHNLRTTMTREQLLDLPEASRS